MRANDAKFGIIYLQLRVQFKHAQQKLLLYYPLGLILSVVMALSFLALVVLVVMPPPPALAEPPGSSIWSEDSGGPTS